MITLRQLDHYLGEQGADTQSMRRIPALRDTANRLDRFHAYRPRLWNWAQDEVARQRAPLEARREALQAAQNDLLDRIHTNLSAVGFTPAGHRLSALEATWPQVADALDRHLRDRRNLGIEEEAAKLDASLQAEGMVALRPKPTDPVVQGARSIRSSLDAAAAQAGEIDRVTQQMDRLTAHSVDEHLVAIEAPMKAAGMVAIPGTPGARPELDADLEAMVAASLAATTSRG